MDKLFVLTFIKSRVVNALNLVIVTVEISKNFNFKTI